jgi:hypothetical protein
MGKLHIGPLAIINPIKNFSGNQTVVVSGLFTGIGRYQNPALIYLNQHSHTWHVAGEPYAHSILRMWQDLRKLSKASVEKGEPFVPRQYSSGGENFPILLPISDIQSVFSPIHYTHLKTGARMYDS